MARSLPSRLLTFCCGYRLLFVLLEFILHSSVRIRTMISTIRLQQILTVGLLTYLYMAVLFMFQNSRYSTWQRYYRNVNDSLPDEVYLSNTTGVDYNNLEFSAEKVEYENNKAAINYPDDMISHVHLPQVKLPIVTSFDSNATTVKNVRYEYFEGDFILNEYPVSDWIRNHVRLCNNKFEGYNNNFARFRHVIIDPKYCIGRRGGEDMWTVMKQPESEEYLKLKFGYFQVNCDGKTLHYKFSRRDHLASWMTSTKSLRGKNSDMENIQYIDKFTIAIMRYEYVNMYHTMTDFYNAFLMLLLFKQDPSNVNILWLDAHPKGGLDLIWSNLFGNILRAGDLHQKTKFRDLVWGITGYNSLLNNHDYPVVPYLEEFRNFFLTQHGVSDGKVLNCGNVSILIIWRRGYVAHPRNPHGKVGRKIKNEKELEESLKRSFPQHIVRGEQLDTLDIKEQLNIISRTDILIGMHGAGLTMTLFLPQHAGVVELYPRYWSTANKHFKAMASWRKLHYRQWQNRDGKREFPDQFTYVPPEVLIGMIQSVLEKMCPQYNVMTLNKT